VNMQKFVYGQGQSGGKTEKQREREKKRAKSNSWGKSEKRRVFVNNPGGGQGYER